jgi:hypothetical protein
VPNNTKPAREQWKENVTYLDVVNFSLERASRAISNLGLADLQRDEAAMIESIKAMRNIATRMDAFRRIRVKKWDTDRALKFTTERLSP